MNRGCKSRLKKDGSHRKTKTNQGPDSSLTGNTTAEISATGIQYGRASGDVQIQDLACCDVPELPCSQEPLLYSSQEICSQHEVRWDYQSPETVKKLKKCRGQYSTEDVRSIVENFKGTQAKPEDTSLISQRLHLTSKHEAPLTNLGICQKDKAKVTRKYKRRLHIGDSVQQMIKFLHDQTTKSSADCETECNKLSEASSCNLNEGNDRPASDGGKSDPDGDEICWSDEDDTFLIEATQNQEKLVNATRNLVTVPIQCNSERTCIGKALFTDSFVIPPSCTSKKPSVMGVKTSVKVPCSSVSSYASSAKTFKRNINKGSVLYSTSVASVPSSDRLSCSKSTTVSCAALRQQCATETTSECSFSSEAVSAAASQSRCLNSFQFTNVKEMNQNSQSVIMNPPPSATYKTSFRKFSNFQIDSSLTRSRSNSNENNGNENSSLNSSFRKFNSFHIDSSSARSRSNSDKTNGSQNSSLNSSFRKTLSFDSTFSPSRNTDQLCRTNKTKAPNLANPKSTSTATNIKSGQCDVAESEFVGLNLQSAIVSNFPAAQEDGFDVSLPDDVFETLLEVDEILSSQRDVNTTTVFLPNNCDKETSCDKALGTISEVSKKFSFKNRVKVDALTLDMSLEVPTTSNFCDTTNNAFKNKGNYICDIPESNSKMFVTAKLSEISSPVRSVVNIQNRERSTNSPTHAYFKKTFSLKRESPRLQKTEKLIQPSLPSSSTPVKYSKNGASNSAHATTPSVVDDSSASFLEGAFDDSFTNNMALFESQILPVLEQAEAEAMLTQAEPSCPVKCSSKEIEEKRQIALQKRSLKLSQSSQINRSSQQK